MKGFGREGRQWIESSAHSENCLNPSPVGFSLKPATSKAPQVVRFSPEIGSKESQASFLGMNGRERRDDLRAQCGRNGVQMDHLRDADQEPTSWMLGLDGFLGLKEVQPMLCGLLGPDLTTWLSVGKASIVTLYRVSRALGAGSKGIEQEVRGEGTSSILRKRIQVRQDLPRVANR